VASGWARDGAVQDQIDASVAEAVERARQELGSGESAAVCEECDKLIPEARRQAIPGIRFCVACQAALEALDQDARGMNRRGSKDSQLR
jgi:phage/conjugal plasmid C-4 type zinc finger TraR family protein|tara:strand:- start:476 stop:742 length:267 start_codon:yes stop_codon:yes gene_type:complete